MVQLLSLDRMSIPETELAPVPKKSKILLPSMTLAVLGAALEPNPVTALRGRSLPAGPILLPEIVLLLLPVLVVVLRRIVPPWLPTVTIDEPRTVQFLMTLLPAPLINRSVLVPTALLVLKLESVREFPFEFKPSKVTKSAPLKSTNGAARLPEIIRATPPAGCMRIEVYKAEPLPLAFNTADADSVVSPSTEI